MTDDLDRVEDASLSHNRGVVKKLLLPLCLAVVGLTLPFFSPTPFTLLVVDEQTGTGVPSLRVTDEDGMVRRTGAHGELMIWSASSDRFEIRDERNGFDPVVATLQVAPGQQATVKIRRRP